MRILSAACAALLLVSGLSYGATYTWNGGAGAVGSWTVGTNWSPNGVPGNQDNAVITTGSGRAANSGSVTVGALIVNGSGLFNTQGAWTLTCDNHAGSGDFVWSSTTGMTNWQSTAIPVGVMNVGGNFLETAIINFNNSNQGYMTLNLSGLNKGVANHASAWNSVRYMNVSGSYYDNGSVYQLETNVTNTITVKPLGSILAAPGSVATSVWRARTFVFQGGQANLPALGSKADFWYSNDAIADNNPTALPSKNSAWQHLAVAGGLTYPRDVIIGPVNGTNRNGNASAPRLNYNWTFTRTAGAVDTTIGRDFLIGDPASSAWFGGQGREYGAHWLNLIENNTTNAANLTVGRDFYVGLKPQNSNDNWGLRLYGSTLRVQGSLLCGGTTETGRNPDVMTGAMVMGNATLGVNATIYVGQNFNVRYPGGSPWFVANWDPAGSTVVMGNGTNNGRTQVMKMEGNYGIALHNLIIDSPGNKVNLDNTGNYYSGGTKNDFRAGDLRLTGDLTIKRGWFNSNNSHNQITFNGPAHQIQDNTAAARYTLSGVNFGTNFDNIVLLANSVLSLQSDILITSPGENKTVLTDNLVMGAGSAVYLNGFKLFADGYIYDGTAGLRTKLDGSQGVSASSWSNDGGTIFAGSAPEPATLLLLGTGALGAIGWMRRRRVK